MFKKMWDRFIKSISKQAKKNFRNERIVCNKCGHVWNCTFFATADETKLECPKCHERDSRIF